MAEARDGRTEIGLFPAEDRPTAQRHFETIEVHRELEDPERIVVVDDIVTSGSMLLAAASLLEDAFPSSRVETFALARAISGGDVAGCMHQCLV